MRLEPRVDRGQDGREQVNNTNDLNPMIMMSGEDGSASHSRGVREYQFDFLVRRQGLLRSDTLLDLGCGVLRGGMPLINYLEPGRYWGLDVSPARLAEGWRELSERSLEHKRPQHGQNGHLRRASARHHGLLSRQLLLG